MRPRQPVEQLGSTLLSALLFGCIMIARGQAQQSPAFEVASMRPWYRRHSALECFSAHPEGAGNVGPRTNHLDGVVVGEHPYGCLRCAGVSGQRAGLGSNCPIRHRREGSAGNYKGAGSSYVAELAKGAARAQGPS